MCCRFKLISRTVRYSLPVVFLFLCNCTSPKTETVSVHLDWLLEQIVPNAVIAHPFPSRRNLVVSYEIPPGDPVYPYLYSKSFLYDNALTVIALCSQGKWAAARRTLLNIDQLIQKDGSLWFSYNVVNEWPNKDDKHGGVIRTGAIAWMGYAFCFYLENNPVIDPRDEVYQRLLQSAARIAEYIVNRQIFDTTHPLYGLVTGGTGEWKLQKTKNNTIEEVFNDIKINWASTEHNIDAHLFLSHLYTLTGKEEYLRAYRMIETSLINTLWSEHDKQFFRGIKGEGKIDSVLALDCATWGSVFLINIGKRVMAEHCIDRLLKRYKVSRDSLSGFVPYANIPVYENAEVNKFYYPDDPTKQWGSFAFNWLEGSYGVVLTLCTVDRRNEARKLLKAQEVYFDPLSGGIPYCSKSIPYQFSNFKSVASTSWEIVMATVLNNSPLARPFFSP